MPRRCGYLTWDRCFRNASAVYVRFCARGGWHFPGITDPKATDVVGGMLLPFGVFMAKLMAILTLTIWIRWTLPRFRYDQLMSLGWKVLVPISLANLMWVGVVGAFRWGG